MIPSFHYCYKKSETVIGGQLQASSKHVDSLLYTEKSHSLTAHMYICTVVCDTQLVKSGMLAQAYPRAADIIRDAIFRGADGGYLLTDRKFAGSDTLATSYALSCALRKIQPDVIVAGRQAIDGDTAQVGPQVAEKLGLPQVTYAEEILEIKDKSLVIKRRLEHGTEVVECPIPAVVTVNASAAECRPKNARRVMKFKNAMTASEIAAEPTSEAAKMAASKPYLQIFEWSAADVDPDDNQLGLTGSPTKVKKIENVVFQAKEAKKLTADDKQIEELMVELIASHTLG